MRLILTYQNRIIRSVLTTPARARQLADAWVTSPQHGATITEERAK